jgi:hypothetical protein
MHRGNGRRELGVLTGRLECKQFFSSFFDRVAMPYVRQYRRIQIRRSLATVQGVSHRAD